MKDIYSILKDAGVEIAEDKKDAFNKDLFANYKSVAEFTQKNERIKELEGQVSAAQAGLTEANKKLEGYKDVNVDDLKGQITKLTQDLTDKETAWQARVAGMEFDNAIEKAISGAKGKNTKAIKALLDMDSLKKSTNRDADVKAAIEAVKKENDYLFETEVPPARYAGGTGTGVRKSGGVSKWGDADATAFARGMGLKIE